MRLVTLTELQFSASVASSSIPLLPGDGWLCGARVPALDPARHLEAEHGGDSAFIVTAAPVRVQTPGL